MYKIKADPGEVTLEELVLVFASLFGRLENWQYENLPLSVRHLFAYEHPEEQYAEQNQPRLRRRGIQQGEAHPAEPGVGMAANPARQAVNPYLNLEAPQPGNLEIRPVEMDAWQGRFADNAAGEAIADPNAANRANPIDLLVNMVQEMQPVRRVR